MKIFNIMLNTLVMSSFILASSDKELTKKINEMLKNNNVPGSISQLKDVDIKNLKIGILTLKDKGEIPILVGDDAKTIIVINDGVLTENEKVSAVINSSIQHTMKKNTTSKIEKIESYISKNKDAYLSIKGDINQKKIIYIFSDPNCPYCKKAISKQLSKYLTSYREIRIIPVGVIKEDSLLKASDLIELNKLKLSDKEKIKRIKEIYSNSYYSISKEPSQIIKNNDSMAIDIGVNAVPYEIEGLN